MSLTVYTPWGYHTCMSTISNRLKRLEGQLARLRVDIEADTDCAEIIPQFQAVRGALAGAFQEYVSTSLDRCVDTRDETRMKRLITQLTRS